MKIRSATVWFGIVQVRVSRSPLIKLKAKTAGEAQEEFISFFNKHREGYTFNLPEATKQELLSIVEKALVKHRYKLALMDIFISSLDDLRLHTTLFLCRRNKDTDSLEKNVGTFDYKESKNGKLAVELVYHHSDPEYAYSCPDDDDIFSWEPFKDFYLWQFDDCLKEYIEEFQREYCPIKTVEKY